MKPHQRRAAKAYPYYRLNVWQPLSLAFKPTKRTYTSSDAARNDAKQPGRYRIEEVLESGVGQALEFCVGSVDSDTLAQPGGKGRCKSDLDASKLGRKCTVG